MTHPLDRVVASDLSQQVLEMRRLRAELGPQIADSSHRRVYRVSGAEFRQFIADPDMGNVDGADDAQQVKLSKRRRGRG